MADRHVVRSPKGFPALVLFDMDDTIFDDSATRRIALQILRREEPILTRVPLASLFAEYGRLLEAVHPEVVAGRLGTEEARAVRFERLAMFCGDRISAERASELARRYRAEYQARRRAVPGAAELLRRVRRWSKVGVVSNNFLSEQLDKLARLDLTSAIDVLVVSETAGMQKPDPRIFRLALERAAVPAEESVMIGDSWANDVLGARAAGIRPIWFNRFGAPSPEPERVPELRSFRPLREALGRIGNP